MIGASTPVSEQLVLSAWTQKTMPSALQHMLSATAHPDIISFALGLPAPELFPAEAFGAISAEVLRQDVAALQYGPPSESLKASIVALMALRGVECRAEQIFLTNGAQQGMNMLARLLLDPGGSVLIEDCIYTGFQQVLEPFQPTILTVPADVASGMDVDAVAAHLESGKRPAFIYAITDGHNPLGVSMSAEKRAQLVALARDYRVPIIEDDAYGFLSYAQQSIPPLRALSEDWVFYVGSFSKILAPALRVGWVIVPEWLIDKLSIVKEASDIGTATFSQRLVAAYVNTQALPAHLARLRHEYAVRRDAMLDALEHCFPATTRWYKPDNGMFIWIELPETVNSLELLRIAITDQKVAFIPGTVFSVGERQSASNGLRLNFSNCNVARIQTGIERLAATIKALPQ
ncbi:MAG: PLP-dependent aminotransferase family protein [Herpetosiphonaceae bacterium]|nr:PLP-dependent aminotransferase family protein [Herpetosiphonaceae bacterium]